MNSIRKIKNQHGPSETSSELASKSKKKMKYILYLQAKGYASTIRANRHTYNIAPNFSHSINTIISEHMEIAYSCQSQHAEGN